jgi:ATP-dependent Clp protease adapter protein ClpS
MKKSCREGLFKQPDFGRVLFARPVLAAVVLCSVLLSACAPASEARRLISSLTNGTGGGEASSALADGGSEAASQSDASFAEGVTDEMKAAGFLPGAGLFGGAANGAGYYCYEQLGAPERALYNQILYSVTTRQPVTISGRDADESAIERVFANVCADHPEIFDVNGYVLGGQSSVLFGDQYEFRANYIMEEDEAQSARQQAESVVSEILSGVPAHADDFTKAKCVFDTIIDRTRYDESAGYNQTMLSVFLEGKSVCAGYSAATEYLLQRLGIRCGTLSGTATQDGVTENHAWNIALLDGAYYHIDTTYGDPVSSDSAYTYGPNYDYLGLTTEEILLNHRIDESQVAAQPCTEQADNYYVHMGHYFVNYDEQLLAQLFDEMYATGQTTLSIRCADAGTYEQMLAELIDGYGMFEYLRGAREHGYRTNDELHTIEVAVQAG